MIGLLRFNVPWHLFPRSSKINVNFFIAEESLCVKSPILIKTRTETFNFPSAPTAPSLGPSSQRESNDGDEDLKETSKG